MRRLRNVTTEELLSIEEAACIIASAQRRLRAAGATKAAAYSRCAQKSAEGAVRHAQRCRFRAADEERRAS